MTPKQTKKLLVEGFDDLFAVVGLMRHHTNWPKDKMDAPVWIEIGFSAEKMLEKDFLSAKIKESNYDTLGIMLDADLNADGRYQSFRNICVGDFPELPKHLPKEGLIHKNQDGKRIGLWVMPDNNSRGAIEIFLKYLIPDSTTPIWEHAIKSVVEARGKGAACKECHLDKANLFTWLAWQDEPGQNPGIALTRKILNPYSDTAKPFVKWFMELYQLEHLINL